MKTSLMCLIFLVVPMMLLAQGNFNITGRVSLQTLNVSYDEKSSLKPDSIPDDQYAKSTLIPGLQQRLNLALFARSRHYDITLLGDLKNNQWDRLDNFQRVDRLTLNIRRGRNEMILGDFFQSGSDLFVQSREMRGFKLAIESGKTYYYKVELIGGQSQKPLAVGDRLPMQYRQYETSGQFQRYLGAAQVKTGKWEKFEVGLKFLWAKDNEKSIEEAISEPLTNQLLGLDGQLYLWKKRVKWFFDANLSRKDTLSAQNVTDLAYRAGFDLRLGHFKMILYKQYLGYDYYSAGYPYLQTDRDGFVLNAVYNFPQKFALSLEGERYFDNLKDFKDRPRTTTNSAIVGITSMHSHFPEVTLKFRYRDDRSNTVLDSVKTDKLYMGLEGRISFGSMNNRLSLSAIYLDLDDRSILQAGAPLGTKQFISSVNFYLRPHNRLFISGGSVFSRLQLSNDQQNINSYTFTSGRWDVIPVRLRAEFNLSFIYNDAANGGYQDMLSDYNQLASSFSLEYFFNTRISLKAIVGNDFRDMRYSLDQARLVINDPDYGPTYFNGFESYNSLKYGMELNWIF
ncbi:hypothetical protein Calab_1786 [Caldithrix abyssi DSM 13497]|uniref:Uncharacterized protein n=2 Tax=Caldithrix abyssi DSM 13497 TaxID=880073 RepID=H1XSX3_CALAY|nr:hypothetical protein [Caldithrix abyssi]EHO41402.1 hypothetical protein Calab_1786 [Caldithrix abyssi DSM 13497]